MKEIFIGTSGWVYGHWEGIFYPQDLPSKDKLKYFSKHFKTAEINYSFYHLPRPSTYQNWYEQTPEDFLFAVNGSTDLNYDGLLVIYNEKQDKPLAIALHDALWDGLTKPPEPNVYIDEGLDHGGYGMTVYGHLVSALTEAYYITNDWEAEQYLNGTSTRVCDNKSVLIGNRINQEADALYQGLFNYFSAPSPRPPRR